LKNNRKFVLEVLSKNTNAIKFVSKKLQKDRGIRFKLKELKELRRSTGFGFGT